MALPGTSNHFQILIFQQEQILRNYVPQHDNKKY